MLQVYSLTPLGRSLARSTSAPNNPEGLKNYRVISWLDKKQKDTPDGISMQTGISRGDLATTLRRLRFNHVITEDTGMPEIV